MQISVSSNIDQLTRDVPRALRREIPFATAGALVDTARQARKDVIDKAPAYIDDPKMGFLRKFFRYGPPRISQARRTLTAYVAFTRTGWDAYEYQVNPGIERAQQRYTFIALTDRELKGSRSTPASRLLKRDKFGNVRQGRINKAIQHPHTFIDNIRGTLGLWERRATGSTKPRSYQAKAATGTGGLGLRLLGVFVPRATYTRRFPYARIVGNSVDRSFNRFFVRRFERALKSSRVLNNGRGSF